MQKYAYDFVAFYPNLKGGVVTMGEDALDRLLFASFYRKLLRIITFYGRNSNLL